MAFVLAAAAFVIGVPTDQNVDRIIAGDNITISPENGYGIVTIHSTGVGNGNGVMGDNNVTRIIAGDNIDISPDNGYGDVTINTTIVIDDIKPLQLDEPPQPDEDGFAPTYNMMDDTFTWVTVPDSAWTTIAVTTLTSDNTNVNFYGLDMETDGPYMIYMLIKHATATNNDIRLFFNEDDNTSHYYVQQFQANDTTIAASRLNEAWIAYGDGLNSAGFSVLNMGKLVGGYPRTFTLMARPLVPSQCQIANLMHIWDDTNNVTSITFAGRSAGCIGAGSRFIILGMI